LRGKRMLAEGQQKLLQEELEKFDWSIGAGGKLKQLLIRGVGIHHAGLLPKYRRAIESLFQKKLLSVCVCTETLAAGINLPARSVVMTSLLKGPPGRRKVIDASSAHQMFGRAGRPQFDDRGYVFAVAHEDDVRLFKWQEKYDAIPDNTKDPLVLRAKKNLKKKMPKRREGEQYWTEKQFQTLREAPPGKLASHGRFPWRLLAYLIRKSGTVEAAEAAVHRRLLDSEQREEGIRNLRRMLRTLEAGGFITLDPPPPNRGNDDLPPFQSRMAGTDNYSLLPTDGTVWTASHSRWTSGMLPGSDAMGVVHDFSRHEDVDDVDFGLGIFEAKSDDHGATDESGTPRNAADSNEDDRSPSHNDDLEDEPEDGFHDASSGGTGLLGALIQQARDSGGVAATNVHRDSQRRASGDDSSNGTSDITDDGYEPRLAIATERLDLLFAFRSVNPIYAVFLAEHFHRCSFEERLQLMESVMAIPRSAAGAVRVPFPDRMPPGPFATEFLNPRLLSRGLVTQDELQGYRDEETGRRIPPLALGDKARLLFRGEFPGVSDVEVTSVWCVGELLRFDGDFNRFVRAREATKQEGILFRHCLRMILLCGEFALIEPPGLDPVEWRTDLSELAWLLTESCRRVDPASTDEILESLTADHRSADTLL
ncbi:MAG: hypothetical protein KDA96_15760, partial [Planctomycetaceae bacterium]|nr:hypothetical protein [Planctomycetaceae bacterium]